MTDIFISYARSTAAEAHRIAEALRALGYGVWRDDELPAHRAYADVIEERLKAAKAVVVVWSAEAVKSQWVRAEADLARGAGTLVQLSIDGAVPPLPFNQIQCADMAGWSGDTQGAGWSKVVASIADLAGKATVEATAAPQAPRQSSRASIAVLPFANLSGDPEQEYFADGIVVEIVAALARFRSLFVIASGSSLSFKGKGLSPREAAAQLGVQFVLEGSVRKAGGRVRIAVQLIDAGDGAPIWTHRFEDTLEDIFALQDTVALAVAGQIEPALQVAEVRRASKRPTDNMGSYDLLLRALPPTRAYGEAGIAEALGLLDRAIALDPDYASALSLAGFLHYLKAAAGWTDDPDFDRRAAIDLSHRALRAAPGDAYVLSQTAVVVSNLERDEAHALALLDRAVDLNPGAAVVWLNSGGVRVQIGDVDRGVEHLEAAIRLDPMGPNRPMQMGFLGIARFLQQRFDEAIPLLKELAANTDNVLPHAFQAAIYGYRGEAAAGTEALSQCRILAPMGLEFVGQSFLHNPAHIKLFVDGLALAEGMAGGQPPQAAAP
jgi:adenylate cyclase